MPEFRPALSACCRAPVVWDNFGGPKRCVNCNKPIEQVGYASGPGPKVQRGADMEE